MIGLLVFLVAVGAFYLITRSLANDFAAEQIRRGRWDEHGPLVETSGPPTGLRERMSWILEAKGLYTPTVVRDRRREAKRTSDPTARTAWKRRNRRKRKRRER